MKIGSIVKDKQSKYDGDGVVISISDSTAGSVTVPGSEKTVAEVNPTYSSDSMVAEICFINSLERNIPRWWMMDKKQLCQEIKNADIKSYYYPTERLEFVEFGLMDGLVIDVAGVADPFDNSRGAYAFEASKVDTDISYTESEMVEEYSNITKTVSTLAGILNSLKWIKSRDKEDAVQIVVDDENVVKKITGKYQTRSNTVANLLDEIRTIDAELSKVDYRSTAFGDNKNLKETAAETYRDSGEKKFEIDRVIDDEYIVDGIFSVNLSERECTCDENKPCDHLQAVEEQTVNQ